VFLRVVEMELFALLTPRRSCKLLLSPAAVLAKTRPVSVTRKPPQSEHYRDGRELTGAFQAPRLTPKLGEGEAQQPSQVQEARGIFA
jgi:hypothetical protein